MGEELEEGEEYEGRGRCAIRFGITIAINNYLSVFQIGITTVQGLIVTVLYSFLVMQ